MSASRTSRVLLKILEEYVFYFFYKIKTATKGQSSLWRNARVLSRYNELGLTNQSARISLRILLNTINRRGK